MKTRPILVGLIIAAAGLGGWIARVDALVLAANGKIADLNQKVAAAQHDATVARDQILKQKAELADETSASKAFDPKTALAMAEEMPPGAARDGAMKAALMAAAATNPQTAWDFALGLTDVTNDFRVTSEKEILKLWSATDPVQAITMLNTLPPAWAAETSSNANNITGVIESNWFKQDPVAAEQWINSFSSGNTRDSAILGLVSALGGNDPATAFTWASTMNAVLVRNNAVNRIVAQWARVDPAAAANAVLATYPDNKNGRQAALLAIIQPSIPNSSANPDPAASGNAPAP